MTEIVVKHSSRNRVYVRRFDHYEAAQRCTAGESMTALAAEYGVTRNAVAFAIQRLDPARREAHNVANRAGRTTVCELCGGPAMKLVSGKAAHNPDGRVLCRVCRRKEMREAVRVTRGGAVEAVRCLTCRAWKPPGEFGRGKRYTDLREGGFHNQCRPCCTLARQTYRARNKIPCEGGCGRLVEGKGRGNSHHDGHGGRVEADASRPYLCQACWHASPAGQAAHQASVAARRKPA